MTFIIRKGPFQRAMGSSKSHTRVAAMVNTSRLELFAKKDSHGWIWALFRFHGIMATLPSTTNNRMLTVPRNHILKQLDLMIENGSLRSYMNLKKLRNDVRGLRGFLTKNPDQQEQLQALTHLYQALTKDKGIQFETDPKKRALVLLMLSPDMNRFDSHNIPKAFCDWAQEMKIIANDRHVDAFGRRKSDHGICGQSSDILIMRYGEATASVEALLNPMMDIIKEIDKKNGIKRSVQTELPI